MKKIKRYVRMYSFLDTIQVLSENNFLENSSTTTVVQKCVIFDFNIDYNQ